MKFSFNRKQKKADTESGDGVQRTLRVSAEEDMKALSVGGRPFVFILLGAFILMICACAAAFFITVKGAEEVLVPNVEGKDLASALLEMQIKELYPRIQLRYSETPGDEGTILSQEPAAGSIVKAGRRINLVVSRGVIIDQVEDYVGQKFDDVQLRIQTLFSGTSRTLITIGAPQYKADASEAGTILEQDPPAGTDISEPIVLRLIVSRGPSYEQTRVPSIVGMSVNDVLTQMSRSKVIFDFSSHPASENEKPGTVVSQQKYSGEFIRNYSRLTADFAMPEQEIDGLKYGIFSAMLQNFPYPLELKLDAKTPENEEYTIVTFNHPGGQVTIPYAVPSGTILSLSVAGRLERTVQVR